MSSQQDLTRQELEHKVNELTKTLNMQYELVRKAEKMVSLGELVAGIAHEINTPLGALKSNYDLFERSIARISEILFAQDSPETVRNNRTLHQLLENIEKLNKVNRTASERITEIVNSVRRYARQDEADPVEADLHEILESALVMVRHLLKNRIQVHREYGSSSSMICFPSQLNQVFVNLLVNASHAIPEKGDIYIKTASSHDSLTIEIRDTGSGMTPEVRNRIFEAGFTTKPTGMGMGLSIVKSILEAHHGQIEVESEPGQGTTFRIILPGKCV